MLYLQVIQRTSLTLEGDTIPRFCMLFMNLLNLLSGATPETVKKAFELLMSDKSVTSILVNVFGGTSGHLNMPKPIVCRAMLPI